MRGIRIDRGTLRAAGFLALLTVVFLVTNTAVAWAADGNANAGGSGLLAPFNVVTAEGGRLDAYQLQANGGSSFNVVGQLQALVMSGLFALARLLVGMCCWLIGFVFRFPLLALLTGPAQHLADAYQMHVVDALSLKGLTLAWGFVFGLVLVMRGKAATGFGQIAATLVIGALAASLFIRPDYLLGRDGPLDVTHQAAIEVASITTSSYFGTQTSSDPCDMIAGPTHGACENSAVQAAAMTRPIQNSLTDALVVKPYMLLQYGQILDPHKDKDAYEAHRDWIKKSSDPSRKADAGKKCDNLPGPAKEYCHGKEDQRIASAGLGELMAGLEKAGPTGKAAATYAKEPSWDRAFAALALLVACLVVAAMVVSMALVMLGAQGADAAAAGAGPVVWVLAMLPGPTRTLLWRWTGVLVTSALVTFATAVGLPLFGIAAGVLLSDSGPDVMAERLLLLDALAIAFLVMHKRIAGSATSLGRRVALRMQYARLTGTGYRSAGLALGLAGGHGTAPFSLGRAVAEARGAVRTGFAPVALAMRGAHAALIGPKPGTRHPAAKALEAARTQAGSGGAGRAEGEVQVDKWTGEVLHDPATDRPLLSARLHSRASRLRGYRIAHRVGRAAYGATLGLPRTVHTAKGKTSEFTEDARTQLRVSANRIREDAAGWQPVVDGTVKAGRAVGQGAVHTGRAVRDTAISAAVYTAPATTGRAVGPQASISRPDHPTGTTPPASAAGRAAVRRPVPAPATGSGRPAASRPAQSPKRGNGAATPAAPAADQAAANAARLRAAMNRRRQGARGHQEGGTP
ncbi:hypothetical protein [Streptomyces roseus]|uniref:hypothetical protein n=1 Tax=Streptomyces roseus TaxID=66430 RepID=UPI00069E9068|nr:hypothetical protein [Streptomyces roseus]